MFQQCADIILLQNLFIYWPVCLTLQLLGLSYTSHEIRLVMAFISVSS